MRLSRSTSFLKKTLLVGAMLVLSGCSFVRIQNVSEHTATVSVRTPDSGKSYTRIIPSGNIVDVFSSHGGKYTVTVVPGERYKETLYTLREQITTWLFEERATLTADQVSILVNNLNNIDGLISDLSIPGASCSGSVPDFDTSVAIVAYDIQGSVFTVSCGSSL